LTSANSKLSKLTNKDLDYQYEYVTSHRKIENDEDSEKEDVQSTMIKPKENFIRSVEVIAKKKNLREINSPRDEDFDYPINRYDEQEYEKNWRSLLKKE
jgi:hypothetical protein